MKSISITQRLLGLLLLISSLFVSCDDKMDEHYEKPDWLKGSIWNVLEAEENYSVFLEGVEKTGFRPYLEGKGILTVMAPDNNAFALYLSKHGYSSINDIPINDLKKLIGFHLLYYSYNKASMENFRPEGQGSTDEETEILDAGLYYKFRTRSANYPSEEINPVTGKKVTIYHLERFIPVFSHYFFKSKGIDDVERNYKYFYPDSEWNGANGFNVSEASVKDYELVANNGYVYTIDKVLKPLETIYEELRTNSDYSDFLNLYDTYTYYEYDATLSADYGSTIGVDSLYLHYHNILPPIALEWPTSNFVFLNMLASVSYSVFAPSNDALTNFFNSYWKGWGYNSYNDIDPLIKLYFLYEFFYRGSVVFPDQIAQNKLTSMLGTPYNFDPYSLTYKKMCVNGSLYGLDNIQEPIIFNSVAGPAFREKDFICFLYAMDGISALSMYGNQSFKYTVLMPNENAFKNMGYGLISNAGTNSLVDGPDEEEPVELTSSQKSNIVDSHVVNKEVELKTTGMQVLETSVPYNYWFIKDGKVTCNRYFNKLLIPGSSVDPFIPFKEVKGPGGGNWNNGKVYIYEASETNDAKIFDTNNSIVNSDSNLQYALFNCNDSNYPYYAFAQLLKKAGILVNNKFTNIAGRYIAFIPTNQAIEDALLSGNIPGAKSTSLDGEFDVAILKTYLTDYFIIAGGISTYPYIGSEMKTGQYYNYNEGIINYTDNGTSLSVQLQGGTTIPVSSQYYYFPFAYNDGAFHFINKVF